MGWIIYSSTGVPLVQSKEHDHTLADESGVLTNDEHDGYSEYTEIAPPGAGAANKGRLYSVDRGGYTMLEWVDSAGVISPFSNVPACYAYRTTAQTAANGSGMSIVFDAVRYDTDNMHDPGVNPTRVTVVTPGIYCVAGVCAWVSNAVGRRALSLRLNAARIDSAQETLGITSNQSAVPLHWPCIVGDYFELRMFQTSGGNLNSVADVCALMMHWVAPLP